MNEKQKPRIMVIGDFFSDRTIFYRTERESPEGGHSVVRQLSEINGPGGAGAVAAMCRALGADVVAVGAWRPRESKVRHVVDGRVVFRVDQPADSTPISGYVASELRLISTSPPVDAVIVADHGKGVISESSFGAAVDLCRTLQIPLIVDPARGRHFWFYYGATALFPNRSEAGGPSTVADTLNVALGMVDRIGGPIEACVVKLDRDGYAGYADFAPLTGPSECPTAEIVDASGAGDQFIAGVAVAVARGAKWPEAVAWGNRLAGAKCRQWGASPVSLDDVSPSVASRGRQPGWQRILRPLPSAG